MITLILTQTFVTLHQSQCLINSNGDFENEAPCIAKNKNKIKTI
jgi:hypothetical protein